MQLENVRDDGLKVRQRWRLNLRHPDFTHRHVLRALQLRQHHREIDLDLAILNRKRGREVVGLEAGLVEDNPPLPDFGGGQRARRHLSDEQLVDDLDDHALGYTAEEHLAVADQADVFQRVNARDGQRRDVERCVRADDQLLPFAKTWATQGAADLGIGRKRW